MSTFAHNSATLARRRRVATLVLATGVLTALAAARPPLEPLPTPFFSFDLLSPSVLEGPVRAADVLRTGDVTPVPAIPGEAFGLVSPADDLDGLSSDNAYLTPEDRFVILFSVDRDTVGVADPHPILRNLGVPYTVKDQARRGHAAGDLYVAILQLTGSGSIVPRDVRFGTNSLVINNYDEGGVDFQALPDTSAQDAPGDVPEDDVDATEDLPPALRVASGLYFTATRQSPSLPELSGNFEPSGAHLFYNPAPGSGQPTQIYAPAPALGLVQPDDIDALVVFDFDRDGRFNNQDRVLFSLTPDSPSLDRIPGASQVGAASDLFLALAGQDLPEVLLHAVDLGLGTEFDNVDALRIVVTPLDPVVFAARHGIRAQKGDINCDGVVDFFDIDPLLLALTGPQQYVEKYPNCFWLNADGDCDGDVDFFDIDAFLDCLAGECDCPE